MSGGEQGLALLQQQLSSAATSMELSFRPMFGGVMAYVGGRPFASLSNVGMALKLDEPGRAALLALPGARPLQYTPNDPPSRSYVLIRPDLTADPQALRPWLERSAAAVAAAPTRRKKRKRER